MFHSPKRLRLTFEPNFQTQSEIKHLEDVEVTVDDDDEEETSSISSCSFTFSYPSNSSSPPSSPVIPNTTEEEESEEEKEKENEDEGKEEEKEEEEEEEERPVAETSCPSQSLQTSYSFSFSSSTSVRASVEGSSSQGNEGASSLQVSIDNKSLHNDLLEDKVTDLVHFMILKYRLRKLITKAEMLKVVIKRYNNQFPVIFKRACKCLEVISGIDVKEVDPTSHSYVLVNSLDLTYDEMLSDNQSMPKNGLLMIVLGVIFTVGNCASEEDIWDFLNIIEVYAGREHFIFGEPRKLITTVWVQENYLEYRQVPNSDPPRYKFLWGPRAHAETSKLQVLEFLVKIKVTDRISLSCWYEEALRDEKEKAQARIGPIDRTNCHDH